MIQLPNGDWVKPEEVKSVSVHYASCADDSRPQYFSRWIGGVHVEYSDKKIFKSTETDTDAVKLRDQIAEQVNKALYEGSKL